MTTRTDLDQARALSGQLDEVNAALAAIAAGGKLIALVVSDPTSLPVPGAGRILSGINATVPATVTTALTNRQTAITAALTALGVT